MSLLSLLQYTLPHICFYSKIVTNYQKAVVESSQTARETLKRNVVTLDTVVEVTNGSIINLKKVDSKRKKQFLNNLSRRVQAKDEDVPALSAIDN